MDRNQALSGGTAGGVCRDGGGGYTREMGTICPFGFSPCFIAFFASKFAISPLKRGVLGA